MKYFMVQGNFSTNGINGDASIQNARWNLSTEWRLGYNLRHGYEVETHLGRYIGNMQWFMPFIGFDWRFRDGVEHEKGLFGQKNKKDNRGSFSLGARWTLPMLVHFEAEIYQDAIVRLSLQREDIPLSKRLRGQFMVNTDFEYMVGLRYIFTKNIGLYAHYDSDLRWGVGVSLTY